MRISEHFHEEEFASRDGGGVRVEARLVWHLEQLRRIVGRPLTVISGYRTPARNAAVGGARSSRHLHGDAADIPYGYATIDQAVAAGFRGIGTRGRYAVHVDMRPGPPARWKY